MTKKSLMIGLIGAVLLAGCGKEEPLRMITDASFPPYGFLRGTEIVGVDVEICRAVAQKLKRPFIVESVVYDAVLSAVAFGKADFAAAGITVTDERKEKVDFSIPYLKTGLVVIYQKSNPFKGDVSQLKVKKIGVQGSTTFETFAREKLGAKPECCSSPAKAVAGMKVGRTEFVIADLGPAMNCVKDDPELAVSDLITTEEYAVALPKGSPALLKAVNETITELQANGLIEKWIKEYTAEANAL